MRWLGSRVSRRNTCVSPCSQRLTSWAPVSVDQARSKVAVGLDQATESLTTRGLPGRTGWEFHRVCQRGRWGGRCPWVRARAMASSRATRTSIVRKASQASREVLANCVSACSVAGPARALPGVRPRPAWLRAVDGTQQRGRENKQGTVRGWGSPWPAASCNGLRPEYRDGRVQGE